ncbi:hypothetical protein GINT2_000731 [Glugoides intestinalis]
MDELISKLRSQVAGTQKELESQQNSTQEDCLVIKEDNELQEITTSQSDMIQKNRFKLDFDILKKHRKASDIKIGDVKECDSFKIDGPLWAIIKSIEVFKGIYSNVFKWELIDDTGMIFASSNVSDQTITVGSLVCLTDFSLWKTGGNHINVVDRNVKSVVN